MTTSQNKPDPMAHQEPVQRTMAALARLPREKAEQVADFAGYVLMKHEEETLRDGISSLVAESQSFDFLKAEEDLYSVKDLKDRYK